MGAVNAIDYGVKFFTNKGIGPLNHYAASQTLKWAQWCWDIGDDSVSTVKSMLGKYDFVVDNLKGCDASYYFAKTLVKGESFDGADVFESISAIAGMILTWKTPDDKLKAARAQATAGGTEGSNGSPVEVDEGSGFKYQVSILKVVKYGSGAIATGCTLYFNQKLSLPERVLQVCTLTYQIGACAIAIAELTSKEVENKLKSVLTDNWNQTLFAGMVLSHFVSYINSQKTGV